MWIFLGIIALLIITVIVIYNRLVTLKNNRENAFADIDVQLKLRFDLIENLVNTVKGYTTHEKETLQKVTDARTNFMHSNSVEGKIEANNQLTGALKSLFAVVESYPDLKANENFLQLQAELSDIENKLAAARRFFNAMTRELNTAIQTFPSNLIAKNFGFTQVKFFELDNETEKKAPKVQF
ncbi:MAG: LemA family protein [candidate division SR1 bacterium]|nr:MAG: LemA family protein [candidate division SR1 bacterium]